MESLIQYIMEAKIKDEISAAKKIMKGNFLCNPADYSCAFTWKDDDFIVIKRPRGLRSEIYDLKKDFNGDVDKAIEQCIKAVTDKDEFIKINCERRLKDFSKFKIEDYVIARVASKRIFAVVKKDNKGIGRVVHNDQFEWSKDQFDIDEETFEKFIEMSDKAQKKFLKEQGKRFDNEDKDFRTILVISSKTKAAQKFVNFTFDGVNFHFRENNISLTDKKEIKRRIEEFVNS